MTSRTQKPALDAGFLPVLPHVLLKLLTTDETHSDRPWLEAIGDEPALAARILSSRHAQRPDSDTPCASLADAVAGLGIDRVRSIVRNSAIQHIFSTLYHRPIGELKHLWWRNSVRVNLAAAVAQTTDYARPEEARLAGVLCGLGALATWAAPSQEPSADEERPGLTPAMRIAHQWAVEWRLHPFLADAIRYHQDPPEQLADAHALVRILRLANDLAAHIADEQPLPLDTGRALFGMETNALDRLIGIALQATDTTARHYEIDFKTDASDGIAPESERRRHRGLSLVTAQTADSAADTRIKLALTREVRDLALMESLHELLGTARDTEHILHKSAEAAHLFFGLGSTLFLLSDRDGKLRAHPLPGQDRRAAELAIGTQGGTSAASLAASSNALLHTLGDQRGTVLDRQIAQLLGSSGVLYLPFMANQTLSALAAFGIEPHQLPRINKQQNLLRRFGRACAQALQSGVADTAHAADASNEALQALQAQARRVVHEVNNPLGIMKNYLKLLALKLGDDDAAKNDLRIFNEEIDRIAAIVRGLVHPAPASSESAVSVDVHRIIRDLIELSAETLFAPSRIQVDTRFAPEMPPILVPRDKLKQILLNLLKNAAEAMPGGGKITLATRDRVNRDGALFVEITVSDTGPGLSPDMLSRLFEPMTSTKGGGHAGLGLAIVYKLVEEIGASITCISEESGLSFHLLIPRKTNNT